MASDKQTSRAVREPREVRVERLLMVRARFAVATILVLLCGACALVSSCGGTGDIGNDAAVDGESDGTTTDSSVDASADVPLVDSSDAANDSPTVVDAADAAPCTATISANILYACGNGATCFPPSGNLICDPTLAPCGNANDWFYFCGGTAQCNGSTTFCCMPSTVSVTPGACGTMSPGGTEAVCGYQCNKNGGYQLCTTDNECAAGVGGTCKPKFVSGLSSLDGSVLGVCE